MLLTIISCQSAASDSSVGPTERCSLEAVEGLLNDFLESLNSRDASKAREGIVDSQADLQWFSDLLYDPTLGGEIDVTQLRSIETQLRQIIDRGDTFSLGELRVIGEQHVSGV